MGSSIKDVTRLGQGSEVDTLLGVSTCQNYAMGERAIIIELTLNVLIPEKHFRTP